MFILFVNSKSITSQNRDENWFNEIKKHYKWQNNNCVIIFKQLHKLRQFNVWKEVNEIDKAVMKDNVRNEIEQKQKNKNIHDNASQ